MTTLRPSPLPEPGLRSVWLFWGGSQVGGAFSTAEEAERWIAEHGLSGVLTRYPVGMGAYEYSREVLGASFPVGDAATIANYVSGRQKHHHYEDGARVS